MNRSKCRLQGRQSRGGCWDLGDFDYKVLTSSDPFGSKGEDKDASQQSLHPSSGEAFLAMMAIESMFFHSALFREISLAHLLACPIKQIGRVVHPCKLTPTANVIGWGGRCFKPRFLPFFFCRKLGLERWLPPRAFVLGVVLSALFRGSSFCLSFVRLSFFLCWLCLLSLSLSFCRRCADVLFVFCCALASCCCSCRGGGYLLRGWSCMLRCLCLFFCFALLQRKPERCPLVHVLLASSSFVPSSCFLSIWLFFYVVLVVF